MESELISAGRELLLVLGALLPIVNPLGNAPIFLAMTSWASTDIRRLLAWRIAVNAFVLVLVAFFSVLTFSVFLVSLCRWCKSVEDCWSWSQDGGCFIPLQKRERLTKQRPGALLK